MAERAAQRLLSPGRGLSATIHMVGLLFFAASFAWIPYITNPLHNGFGGSYQFLTIIALTMSIMTFGVGLLADVSLSRRFFAVKNLLSICVTPLEVLVSILYWGLRAVDKRLVVPPGHELPLIPDLGFHAMPAAMLILDLMLLSPPWSINISGAMALDCVLMVLYWGWVEYCFSFNVWYPYPLLLKLSAGQKLLLCATATALMTGSTMVLKWAYRQVNGREAHRGDAGNPIKTD